MVVPVQGRRSEDARHSGSWRSAKRRSRSANYPHTTGLAHCSFGRPPPREIPRSGAEDRFTEAPYGGKVWVQDIAGGTEGLGCDVLRRSQDDPFELPEV